ncbi:protein far1-related sequence 11-like [Gigaspora margarita]|uniref:Protein far1-related sequence 11-like n=1 Tax=Gigaspora margarita TaxID=4874 RepID=A0A8H4A3X9_GIGMA|nr:protein far1-related sequence 11-like [Gigaspora margarita]
MLSSKVAKFHIGLILQRWYLDVLVEDALVLLELAIVASLNNQLDVSECNSEVDFSHLENIRGKYVFSKSVRHEMIHRSQWGEGFGMMKKMLNLAIMTNQTEELYKIHENLTKEIIKGFNDNTNISKGKNKKQIPQSGYDKLDNDNNTDSDYNLEASNVKERKGVRKCGICNSKGHNARTCPSLAEFYISDNSEENNSEDNSEKNDPENNSEENNSEAEETNTKRKYGTCNMRGHNARTCSKK